MADGAGGVEKPRQRPVSEIEDENNASAARQEELQRINQQHSERMFALQEESNRKNAELSARSAIDKAHHDAMMNIANNMK